MDQRDRWFNDICIGIPGLATSLLIQSLSPAALGLQAPSQIIMLEAGAKVLQKPFTARVNLRSRSGLRDGTD